MAESGFSTQISQLQRRLRDLRDGDQTVPLEILVQDLATAVEELRVADEEVRSQQSEVARLLADQQLLDWRYERMMSSLPVPILTTSRSGQLRTVNAAGAAVIGIPLASLLRKPVFALVDPADRGPVRESLRDAVTTGATQNVLVRLRLRDEVVKVTASLSLTPQLRDEVTWMFLSAAAVDDGDGAVGRRSLPEALLTLFSLSEQDSETTEVLQQTAYLVAETLGEDVAVSVTLGSPTAPTAVASSDRRAQLYDAWQLQTGEGPSIRASDSGLTVTAGDVLHDPRWNAPAHPEVAPLVAVVATPLKRGEETHGVLTVYLPEEPRLAARLVEHVEVVAASIGSLLHEIGLREHLETLSDDMRAALASRSVIEQAKGIVMAAKHCTADEAFQHLISLSNTSHLKLRDLAAQVVRGTGG